MALGRKMAAYHWGLCETHFGFSAHFGSFTGVLLGLPLFFKMWEAQVECSQTGGEVCG